MDLFRASILLFTATFFTAVFADEKAFTIVTDPWPPYVIHNNDEISGTDVDITRAVFKKLGLAVDIQVKPWKRCIELVKQKKADGILAVSLNKEREAFLHYPRTPISTGVTSFFTHKTKHIKFNNLSELNNKTAGTILGYSYCEELDKQAFIKQSERVTSLEQNFKKLLANRLDFVVEVDSVGLYTAQQMGISDKITILPNAQFCKGGNYLAFAKKPKYDALASQFNSALDAFKMTDAYVAILKHYGITH